MHTQHHNRPLVSATWIVAVLAVASIAVYLLLPEDDSLVERLVDDRNYERAQQVLEGIPAKAKAGRPEYYDTLEVSILGNLAETPDQRTSYAERAVALLQKYPRSNGASKEVCAALRKLPDSGSIAALLQPAAAAVAPEQRASMAELVSSRALSEGNPRLAAELHSLVLPSPDLPQVKERVRLWRMAGDPKEAVYAIDDFIVESNTTLVGIDHELADLFTQVLRETGENERALDVVRERLRNPKGEKEAAQLFDLLNTVALNAGMPGAIRDDYEAWLELHPNDLKALKAYALILVAAGDVDRTAEIYGMLYRIAPGDREICTKYAQYLEWSDQPEVAYDIYLQEAKSGNPEALDRLKLLNAGLNRHADLAAAYEAVPNTYRNEAALRELAELCCYLGHYREAADLYRRLNEMNPGEIAYFRQRGAILYSDFNFAEARQCFESALRLAPDDIETLKPYAMLLNATGEYHASLKYLEKIVKKEPSNKTIESYLSLATSLADTSHMAAALEAQLAIGGTFRDYISLSDVYGEAGQPNKQVEIIVKGLEHFPGETALKKHAIFLFGDRKRFDLVRKVLLTMPNLKTDRELASEYLNAAIEMKDLAEAGRFIDSGLAPSILKDRSVLELAASIHETNGQLERALKEYAEIHRIDRGSLPATLDYARLSLDLGYIARAKELIRPFSKRQDLPVLQIIARIAVQEKDYRAAERVQRKVLLSQQSANSGDWDTLGDILHEQGKIVGARSAYLKAVKARFSRR